MRVMLALLLALGFGARAGAAEGPPGAVAGALRGTTAEISVEAATGCLAFSKALDAGGRPEDFVTFAPAVRPAARVAGAAVCFDGLAFGTRYTVTVKAGLRFADKGRLAEETTAAIETPDREPLIAIGGTGTLLPRAASTGLTIQTINVPGVRVRVLRLSERSLLAGQRNGGPDQGQQSFRLYELRNWLDGETTEVWAGRLDVADKARNATVETAFPLAGLIDPKKPGAYLVLAEDASKPDPVAADAARDDDRAVVAGHWVVVTDLGVSSVQADDGLHVTVRGFADAKPVAGVKLALLSVARDTLAEGVTDAEGRALFAPGLLRGQRGAAPAVLVARTEAGDVVSQDLTKPGFDLSDRGADGRVVTGPLEAFVFTERGIYRPGEVIHAMALLRQRGLSAVDGAGLTFVLRRPDGVEAQRVTLPPRPAAGFAQDLKLSATAAQGGWTVETYVDPTRPAVGRVAVRVEDFVPQQLRVTLTGPKAPVGADLKLRAEIDGRFLYGAPAGGLHGEGQVRLVRDAHPVAGADGFAFGLVDETIEDPVTPLELGDADEAGHLAIEAALKVPEGLVSPLRAEVEAGLVEPGGRAVKETVSVPVRRQKRLIGLRLPGGDRVEYAAAATAEMRVFRDDGTPVAADRLDWRLVREDRHFDWYRETDGGSWTWHYTTTDHEMATGTVTVAAERAATVATKPLEWGEYRLIVSDRATGAASSVRFSVGWQASVAEATPDKLDISVDRETVVAGATAKVRLRAPFAGPAEVVVESGGSVIETRRVELPREGATIDLTASDAWGAGVHVLATAYRPLSAPARAFDPVRAVGLVWIAADPAPRTLAVTIAAPARVLPRQAVRVPVHVAGAKGAAFVTLAAVDEGILQLTKYTTPDPVGTLLGRTRLGLALRDEYGRLLEGHATVGVLHEGGDGDSIGGAGLTVTPARIVSLFQGPVALDANGDATITLDVPDFSGELRLMAVAYDHEAAGRAEAALVVRDPVVVTVDLPRFLAPGDVASATASMANTDGAAGDYALALTATGAVEVRGAQTVSAHLDAAQRLATPISVAGKGVGVGHIDAVLTGPGGLRIAHGWDIAVRSPHPDLVLSRTEPQAAGASFSPDPGMLAAFVPGSARITIGYAAAAGIDLPGLLQSLYTYPYGCTEQLSSGAFPLLYFSDAKLLGRGTEPEAVKTRVRAAIDSIGDRQDSDGRFGLWRVNDGEDSVWLNVYALDFLLHARDAGFAVPERVTERSAAWIERRLGDSIADDQGVYAERPQPTRAYAAYVLARTSRVAPRDLRLLQAGLTLDDGDGAKGVAWRGAGYASALSLAQLAGAQALMGDQGGAASNFGLAIGNLDVKAPPPYWFWYYWSPLRDLAGVLAIAAEIKEDAFVAPLLERLGRINPSPERLNTQEKAQLLLAAHALTAGAPSRLFAVAGAAPVAEALPFVVTPSDEEVTHGIAVRNADSKTVYRTLTVRGSPVVAPPALSAGYRLARKTVTLKGAPLDVAKLKQTDRFIVVLTGSETDDAVRRTVLLDPLPAGWEIERAITKADDFPFLGELNELRAHEQRDDRFVAAFDLGPRDETRGREVEDTKVEKPLKETEFRVAYVVRATTPGAFTRPEAVVTDMYRPELMARTASGKTEVSQR